MQKKEIKTQVVVIGGGPAGYSCAFRCSDLGLKTVIVEKYEKLGGVCLNVGCIPSKALLHVAQILEETKNLNNHGIKFGNPEIDLHKINAWKNGVIKQLNSGLDILAKKRSVKKITGIAKFISSNTIETEEFIINFDYAVIATGSHSTKLPNEPKDPRIWHSTDALNLDYVPKKLLIAGGGIIGLEMATVYHSLGSQIDIAGSRMLIPDADRDIIKLYTKQVEKKFNIMLKTRVNEIIPQENNLLVKFNGDLAPNPQEYDAILIATGRTPNSKNLGLSNLALDNKRFIVVNDQMQTNINNIFAIGDVVGQPMLAHKGVHQGHLCAEVIAGKKHYFDPKVIPSIAYTKPEIAWVGITEEQAIAQKLNYKASIFPWNASGRAIASNSSEGMTKLIFEKDTGKIIGGAVIGNNGGELLGEISLAIEMGCDAEDLALTIHAHPTLYESVGLASEVFNGTITDLLNN